MELDEHLRTNLANWEARVPIHAASAAYGVERFVEDREYLSTVIATDAPHLGDLSGLRVLHLQCHIGTDTLSLARLGAQVTGIDFSASALEVARDLAARAGGDIRYVHAAIDELPDVLPETFDLVYSSVGTISWLPSIARWAHIAAGLVAPGGRLYLRDGHPMMLTLDDEREDRELVISYPYFETAEPQRWETHVTYTGDDVPVEQPVSYDWNHGLAETVQAVLDAGLTLTRLAEGRQLDWRFVPWMVEDPDTGRYVLPGDDQRLPLEFTLEAHKPV